MNNIPNECCITVHTYLLLFVYKTVNIEKVKCNNFIRSGHCSHLVSRVYITQKLIQDTLCVIQEVHQGRIQEFQNRVARSRRGRILGVRECFDALSHIFYVFVM